MQTALEPQSIDEASGIADSRINRGYLWVQEDSGNPPQLYLVAHDAKVKKTIFLEGVNNRDWEDMAIAKGPDPSLDYLYVADLGDNGSIHPEYSIYRFPEPSLTVDTVRKIDRIRLKYPDGSHDAEAFIVDDLNKEIYVITKRDSSSRVYRLKGPINETGVNTLEYITSLKFNGVVSAAIAPDRKSMLVKTYSAIYYFEIKPGISLAEVFKTVPNPVTYQVEPQGEAICFLDDNAGFLTLSEKAFASTVKLFNYRRK
ncbi:MAG: hypothetical protein EOP48_11945 [Sphingobacteriales bacterium]|nr:MAG: hypothetical protein EOP48_11945 [Sphingobacteriales bacterium]